MAYISIHIFLLFFLGTFVFVSTKSESPSCNNNVNIIYKLKTGDYDNSDMTWMRRIVRIELAMITACTHIYRLLHVQNKRT